MRFSIADLLILMAGVGIYIPMFMWGYSNSEDWAGGLMIAGGSCLLVVKLVRIFHLQFCLKFGVNPETALSFDEVLIRHERLHLCLACLGILAIIIR